MSSQGQKERRTKKAWFLQLFLTVFFRVVEIISDTIFWLIYRKTEKITLPPLDNLLLLESASSLALKIRTQKVNNVFQIYHTNLSVKLNRLFSDFFSVTFLNVTNFNYIDN